jgi:hypothetical protein
MLTETQCEKFAQKVIELYVTQCGCQNEQDAIHALQKMFAMSAACIAAIENKTATIIKINSSKAH